MDILLFECQEVCISYFHFYQEDFGIDEKTEQNLSNEMDLLLSKDFLSNASSRFFSNSLYCGSLSGKD